MARHSGDHPPDLETLRAEAARPHHILIQGILCVPFSLPHLRYLPRTAGDVKKGRMRAPSCLLVVLLHAGYVCPGALLPGVRIVGVPGRHAWGRAGTDAAVMVRAFRSVRRGPRERAGCGCTKEHCCAKDDA